MKTVRIPRLIRRWQGANPLWQMLLALTVLILLAMASGSGASLAGPLVLAGFWTVVSADNRTVSVSALVWLGAGGLLLLLPAAAVLESILFLFVRGPAARVLAAALIEGGLLAAATVLLTLWPRSRLRLTGGLADFAVAGLWLGLGLELGIGFLLKTSGFQGQSLGFWPQWPGLVGRPDAPAAAAGPAMWGLLLGLATGLMRYLVGPDLGRVRVRRLEAGGLLILLAWMALERLAFSRAPLSGGAGFWYQLDLQGRLLAYLAGILTVVALVAERLLLKEHDRAGVLARPGELLERVLTAERQSADVSGQVARLLSLQTRRRRERERLFGGEIRPLLRDQDRSALDRRMQQLHQTLAREEQQP